MQYSVFAGLRQMEGKGKGIFLILLYMFMWHQSILNSLVRDS